MSKRTGAQGCCEPPARLADAIKVKEICPPFLITSYVCPSKTLEKLVIAVLCVAATSMREPTEWTSTGDWGPWCLGPAVHTPWIYSSHVPDLKNE